MTADYEAEQERLKLEIETTEEWVEQRQTMGDDLDAFIALTKKYIEEAYRIFENRLDGVIKVAITAG